MAFEDVKARLGLDITPFERGLLSGRNALRNFAGDATKKFTDFKQVGQTVATALGLNLQNIAENVARFITGVTKQAEEDLRRMEDASEKSARATEERMERRRKAMGIDAEIKAQSSLMEQQARKLSDLQRKRMIAVGLGANEDSPEITAMDAEIRERTSRVQDFADKIEILRAESAKKTADEIAHVKGLRAQAADIAHARALDAMSDEERLIELRKEAEALKPAKPPVTAKQAAEALKPAKPPVTAKQAAEALIAYQKKLTEIQNLEQAIAAGRATKAEAEKKSATERNKQIQQQTDALKAQREEIVRTAQEMRRAAELPSMEEVISGKRNIGQSGRSRAQKLERDRGSVSRLADREQQLREQLAAATTDSARASITREGIANRTRLDMARSGVRNMEKTLGARIRDADPMLAQIAQLKNIEAQLDKLNSQTLAPSSTK